MKKIKQPGENISLKTKKTEDPLVMDWINAQTNLMDSLRYLIEHEIVKNGVRNLQAFIPAERNVLGSAGPAVVHGLREIREGRELAAAAVAWAKPDRPVQPVQQVQQVQPVLPKTPEQADDAEQAEQPERTDRTDRTDRTERPERSNPPSLPEASAGPAFEPQRDDEIDDEDIEAWV